MERGNGGFIDPNSFTDKPERPKKERIERQHVHSEKPRHQRSTQRRERKNNQVCVEETRKGTNQLIIVWALLGMILIASVVVLVTSMKPSNDEDIATGGTSEQTSVFLERERELFHDNKDYEYYNEDDWHAYTSLNHTLREFNSEIELFGKTYTLPISLSELEADGFTADVNLEEAFYYDSWGYYNYTSINRGDDYFMAAIAITDSGEYKVVSVDAQDSWISCLGLKIGDMQEKVIEKLGMPDSARINNEEDLLFSVWEYAPGLEVYFDVDGKISSIKFEVYGVE